MAEFFWETPDTGALLWAAAAAADGATVVHDETGLRVTIPDARPLEVQRAERLAQLAEIRWTREQSVTCAFAYQGATYTMPADAAAGLKVTAAVADMQSPAGPATRRWKFAQGVWFDVTLSDLVGLGAAMAAAVQALYDLEETIETALIGAADADALAAIDINAGWPAQAQE